MKNDHLYILWTNDNPFTAEHMVMMYSENMMKMKLWDKITVIIWGNTSKLVAENTHIQELVKSGQEAGVEFTGCIVCAKNLGVVEKLTELNIPLIKWGLPMTEIIKNREHLITV